MYVLNTRTYGIINPESNCNTVAVDFYREDDNFHEHHEPCDAPECPGLKLPPAVQGKTCMVTTEVSRDGKENPDHQPPRPACFVPPKKE